MMPSFLEIFAFQVLNEGSDIKKSKGVEKVTAAHLKDVKLSCGVN